MRAWLRSYATKNPCHGFRGRAWAALRYDERREVNKKKIHRLWREEGLQVKVISPRKRAGVSSIPPVEADAPNVVWAIDFQFDSTTDGKAIKIASMVDEHTRESLLHLVERSITAHRLVDELKTACSKPAWSSVTSRPNTIIDTATHRWATEHRPSTLRHAGAPTPRWPARSTESGTKNTPTLNAGGLSNGDSPLPHIGSDHPSIVDSLATLAITRLDRVLAGMQI